MTLNNVPSKETAVARHGRRDNEAFFPMLHYRDLSQIARPDDDDLVRPRFLPARCEAAVTKDCSINVGDVNQL